MFCYNSESLFSFIQILVCVGVKMHILETVTEITENVFTPENIHNDQLFWRLPELLCEHRSTLSKSYNTVLKKMVTVIPLLYLSFIGKKGKHNASFKMFFRDIHSLSSFSSLVFVHLVRASES